MKKAKSSKQQNKFYHVITIPIRALCKARDFYVRNMLDCANSNAIGLQATGQTSSLPRSFSAASSRSYNDDRDDYRDLVRAASARSMGVRLDVEAYMKQERVRAGPKRSASVAMGRIDEERASNYFGEDVKNGGEIVGNNRKNSDLKYPRSKSDVVTRTSF